MRAPLLLLLTLVSCSYSETTTAPAHRCSTEKEWELGLLGSPMMNPGRRCMECHETGVGAAPRFTAAGTVFETLNEEDDCYGAANVNVSIEDADGKIVTVTTNVAGNFYFEAETFKLPVIAHLERDGAQAIMPRFVYSTDCNDCHSPTGEFGAPGRVLAP